MSGPKGIQYEIQQARLREESALAAAKAEWKRLVAAARRFRIGCEVSGHLDLDVALPATPSGDSASWQRVCGEVRRLLSTAQAEFDRRRREELHRRVEHDISAAVAELERAEASRIAAALDAIRAHESATVENTGATGSSIDAGPTREDVTRSVDAELRRLHEASPELTRLAAHIISSDPRRSRLLVADLASRVSEANRASEARREHERTIDELRARAETVLAGAGAGPDPVSYLDRAEEALAAGGDPGADLRTASDLVSALERSATAHAERRFVLGAVTESLTALGYTVYGTEVDTADSVLLRPRASGAGSHLVRVEVDGEEVGIRTVRTSGSTTRLQDMAADEALCGDLDAVLAGLTDRGVTPGRIRRTEAGVVAPPVVAVRETPAAVTDAAHASSAEAERRRRRWTAARRQEGTR